MPTSLETITSQNLDDIYAALQVDSEDGYIIAVLSGPEGSFSIRDNVLTVDGYNPVAVLDAIDRRLKAWADGIDSIRLQILGGQALDFFAPPESDEDES